MIYDIWYILNQFIFEDQILLAQLHWSYFCRAGRVQSPKSENPSRKISLLRFGLGWRDKNKVKYFLNSLSPNYLYSCRRQLIWLYTIMSSLFVGWYASPTKFIIEIQFYCKSHVGVHSYLNSHLSCFKEKGCVLLVQGINLWRCYQIV